MRGRLAYLKVGCSVRAASTGAVPGPTQCVTAGHLVSVTLSFELGLRFPCRPVVQEVALLEPYAQGGARIPLHRK